MIKLFKAFLPLISLGMFVPLTLVGNHSEAPIIKSAKNDGPDVTDKVVLRIKNMADYISIDEEGTDPDLDIVHAFERYCAENTRFKNVEVVYSTTDTNETLLAELQTGKSNYDLICPSEYMIQKMIMQDLIVPLDRSDRDELLVDYDTYASKYIRNRLDSIETTNKSEDPVTLGDYAVGYMWGTLGILFNPTYNENYKKNVITNMDYYSVLYNAEYNGTISIKDSIRDTYAASLMHVYQDELLGYRDRYLDEEDPSYGAEEYHADIQKVFDRNGGPNDDVPGTLDKIATDLDALKGNIFGLEVDSGKNDIVAGRIGINLAWSGDAVYAMDLGEEENVSLDYSIPLNGSNIWFDAWVMPNNARSDYQEEVAYMFLDYISTPEIAALNMDYTGYTSFIGGQEILELVRGWYDIRWDKNDEFDPTMEPGEDEEWQTVDLNYFFNQDFGGSSYTPSDEYIFKTDEYYVYQEDDETLSKSVGRQFFCQYPDFETITRCAVMKDYGNQYDAILKMWEKFKSNSLPTWGVILFICEAAVIVGAIGYFGISKYTKKRLRKARKASKN